MTVGSIEDLARKLRATETPGDCSECHSAGTVRGHICEICFAELDEAPPPPPLGEALPHPREGSDGAAGAAAAPSPLRFSDVIAELQAIAALAGNLPGSESSALAAACRRAELLLVSLRRQFVSDIAL